jgi:hypothetical protein
MDGHASDLRTGLPFQGVDIHEPVRLLLVVEAPRERIAAALDRLPAVKALVDGRWVNLVAIEPGPSRIWIKEPQGDGAAFVPYAPETDTIPSAPSSWEWCRGHRGNVPPARIGPAGRDHGSGEAVA